MTNDQPQSETTEGKTIFSWKRIFKVSGVIIVMGVLAGGVYWLINYRPFKIYVASVLSDNREHYLTCQELPFYPQVNRAFTEHQDVVQKIKGLGAFDVSANEIDCPIFDGDTYLKKGDIVIRYYSHEQRRSIESLIGDNFFGIPWRGENR